MAEDAGKQKPPSLDEFSKRLDAARGDRPSADAQHAKGGTGMGRAFRLSSELLGGLFVGLLLGWGADRAFGITPWGLITGIFVGFAAGVLNVSRAMKEASSASSDDG